MVVRRLQGVAHLSKSHVPVLVIGTSAADTGSSSAIASNVRTGRTINTAELTTVTAMTASQCLTRARNVKPDDARACHLVICRLAVGLQCRWRVAKRPFMLVLFCISCGYSWIQTIGQRNLDMFQ
jgi:hypothetical protein